MNAYELADEFKNRNWDEVDCVLWCEKSANMLRQQADRIAELEGEVSHLKHINKNWSISEGLALQRIAELNKQLDIHFKNGFEAGKLEGWKAHKYHLTPQTKPLSDEEIDAVLESLDVYIDTHAGVKLFARAIEERHGIK